MSGSCDNLGEPTPKQKEDSVANVLKALGTKSCSTSSDITQFSLAAGGYISTPFGGAGVGMNQDYSSAVTGTDGCEQVAVAADEFASSVKKISCLITSDSSNVNVKTLNTNTIEFDAGRDLEAEDIKLNQKIGVKVVTMANLSNNTKQKIADEVQNAAMRTIEVAQDSKSGMGATPQGSKVVSQAKSDLSQENLTKIVNETIKDVNITTTSQNTILIKSKRDIKLNKTFEATQEIAADIAATIILSNAIEGALESFTKNISETRAEVKQKAEALGADTLGGQAARGLAEMFRAQQSGISSYSSLATVVLAIVAVFFIYNFYGKAAGGGGGGMGGMAAGQVYSQSISTWRKIVIVILILGMIASGVAVWWTNYGGYDNWWKKQTDLRAIDIQKCLVAQPPINEKDCPFSVPDPGEYDNPPWKKIVPWVTAGVCFVGAVFIFFQGRRALARAAGGTGGEINLNTFSQEGQVTAKSGGMIKNTINAMLGNAIVTKGQSIPAATAPTGQVPVTGITTTYTGNTPTQVQSLPTK